MTLEFPIKKELFQLNNKSEGELIEIEFTEVCTSFNNEKALVALSNLVRFKHDCGYKDYSNNIDIPHKTNPFGIRTLGKMYNILRGSGRMVSENVWNENLLSSIN